MAQCPVCLAQIPDDFGLVECGSCSAQLIVHIDGRVEYSGAEVLEEKTVTGVKLGTRSGSLSDLFPLNESLGDLDLTPPPLVADEAQEQADFEPEAIPGPESESEAEPEYEAEAESEPAGEPQAVSPATAMDFDFGDGDSEEPAAYSASPEAVNKDSSDLSDIARFGNSDSSGTREGSLRYNLLITGIDTSDVREAFREALTDRKLMWDTDQILRSVKSGEVRIPNVAAVKAHILVLRLRDLPVQVRWEQYAISQS